MRNSQKGFTLLEMLLVVGMLVGLATLAAGYYGSAFRQLSLGGTAKILASDLHLAQSRSVQGEFSQKWGVYLINSTTDSYELFYTPTNYADVAKVIVTTVPLPNGVEFSDPSEGSTKEVIFNRTTGQTSETTITLQEGSSGNAIIINISSLGLIE